MPLYKTKINDTIVITNSTDCINCMKSKKDSTFIPLYNNIEIFYLLFEIFLCVETMFIISFYGHIDYDVRFRFMTMRIIMSRKMILLLLVLQKRKKVNRCLMAALKRRTKNDK